jgi:hypothetical protein
MAVVGLGKRIDEREIYSGGYLTKKVILRDKLIERELVIEFGSEHLLPHHGLCLLLSGALPGIMISDRLTRVEFGNSPVYSLSDDLLSTIKMFLFYFIP